MNTPISFELAVILFKKYGVLFSHTGDVVMWLYEEHEIWIEVRRTSFPLIGIRFQSYINEKPLTGDLGGFVSHNEPAEAYSEAIKYVLENLI